MSNERSKMPSVLNPNLPNPTHIDYYVAPLTQRKRFDYGRVIGINLIIWMIGVPAILMLSSPVWTLGLPFISFFYTRAEWRQHKRK